MMGNDVAIIGLCVTLFSGAIAAVWATFKVGILVGEMTKTLKDTAKWEAVVAMIPLMAKDIEQVRGEVKQANEVARNVSNRMHSDLPPMRERLESMAGEVDEIKSVRLPERVRVLEDRTGLSTRNMPAARPPRPGTIKREEEDR